MTKRIKLSEQDLNKMIFSSLNGLLKEGFGYDANKMINGTDEDFFEHYHAQNKNNKARKNFIRDKAIEIVDEFLNNEESLSFAIEKLNGLFNQYQEAVTKGWGRESKARLDRDQLALKAGRGKYSRPYINSKGQTFTPDPNYTGDIDDLDDLG